MASAEATRNLTFQGKGPDRQDTLTVMVGDNPPTIQGGYANWTTIPRPLLRGVTVFQGYDPVTVKIEVRFGVWAPDWLQDDNTGRAVEADIERLEWMAGANFDAGPSPYVYANSYAHKGGTTSLIPSEYQQTAGIRGPGSDTRLWPWVISGGVQWGNAIRNPSGYRIWQDATFTLMSFQSFTPPAQRSQSGGYFTSVPGADTALTIAQAASSHALYPENLAQRIIADPKNAALKLRSIRTTIKHQKHVWVAAHQS